MRLNGFNPVCRGLVNHKRRVVVLSAVDMQNLSAASIIRHVCGDHDGNYAMVMGGMRMSLRLKMRMKLGITPRPEGGAPTLRQGTQACANITRTTQDNFTKPLRNDLLAVGRGAVGCIPESAKEWPGMPAIVPYDGCEL